MAPTDDNLASMWRAQQAISGGMSDADLLAHIAESTAAAPDASTSQPQQTDNNDVIEEPVLWEEMHTTDVEEHGITGGYIKEDAQTMMTVAAASGGAFVPSRIGQSLGYDKEKTRKLLTSALQAGYILPSFHFHHEESPMLRFSLRACRSLMP